MFALPENQNFMLPWLTLPLHLLPQGSEANSFCRKKLSMRNKLNDVQAFPDGITAVLRACSEGKLLWIHFHFASNKAHL